MLPVTTNELVSTKEENIISMLVCGHCSEQKNKKLWIFWFPLNTNDTKRGLQNNDNDKPPLLLTM